MSYLFHFPFLLFLGLFFMGGSARAVTINWGTYISPTSYLYDSTGATLSDDFFFELGTFGSFTATEANMSEWLTNWKPFDRAFAPSIEGWNSSAGIVASSATLETDFTTSNTSLSQVNTFAPGEQAYIWIYKGIFGDGSSQPTLGEGFEWALVTNDSSDGVPGDDWLMPVPSGHVATSLDWRIEDASATPFGGLNDQSGPGETSADPATSYILQTHTLLTPVPEPGSALLVSLASIAMFWRRRHRV